MPALSKELPPYTGPYRVGAVDIEAPCDGRLVHAATHLCDGQAAFQLDTVLFTLYYPAAPDAPVTLPRHRWLLEPARLRGEGFARFVNISNWVVDRVFAFLLWALVGSIRIPADVDRETEGPSSRYPVVVFSHGMAASRTDYTQLCGELASRGNIVAAIEHRDGSGPGSVIRRGDGRHGTMLSTDHDPPLDRASLQRAQLTFRQAEMEETVRVLRMLNAGDGENVFRHNARGEGTHLAQWKGRLDIERMILAGHSYGATGVLRACATDQNLTTPSSSSSNPPNPIPIIPPIPSLPIAGCVALDPGKASGPLNTDIPVPLLIIHSHSWSRKISLFMGRPHFDVVRDLAKICLRRTGAAWFMTSLGTSHPSCTDAPIIQPLLLGWATGATVEAREGVLQYVRRMQEFLDFVVSGERKGLLDKGVTHEEYREEVLVPWKKVNNPRDWRRDWQIHVAPGDDGATGGRRLVRLVSSGGESEDVELEEIMTTSSVPESSRPVDCDMGYRMGI
ncbi:platelet-activating factor acetylhydrolase, isoform II-domain-containing protein [Aspergillus granulosus]|uniref:Putative phospholipase n=1 Tax=Aspergillus granulosus TaxID=176169 RepID=A0ABR4HFI6_9EURO